MPDPDDMVLDDAVEALEAIIEDHALDQWEREAVGYAIAALKALRTVGAIPDAAQGRE